MEVDTSKINIMSIFFSISGEINMWPQGTPVIFIRFAGCNCNCGYCDTPDSINSTGNKMSVAEIVTQVTKFPSNQILITGGEPLLQKNGLDLLIHELIEIGYEVSIETNGSLPLDAVCPPDCWVVDIKMPTSGQYSKMLPLSKHLEYMHAANIIFKVPVENEADIIMAKDIFEEEAEEDLQVALSAVAPLTPAILWQLMQKHNLTWCVLNTQIHKMIGLE